MKLMVEFIKKEVNLPLQKPTGLQYSGLQSQDIANAKFVVCAT